MVPISGPIAAWGKYTAAWTDFRQATSISVLSTLAFDDGLHGLLRLSLTLVGAAPHHL